MPEHPSSTDGRQLAITSAPPQIIKAEPNILRLPFFALSTKGLKGIGGYECRGSITRGGKHYQFTFRTSRSVDSQYPGLLSRKAHYAIQSIITERGIPFENPVAWTWGDLFRRMRVSKNGRTLQRTKEAIVATAKLSIDSSQALWSQSDAKPISTTSRRVTHLYDDVVFIDEPLRDGSIADTNYLWLSNWYLDNLNANYFSYLDHELWSHLDRQSPIASRLYELSLSKFSGTSILTINYSTLAQLLPVRPERYFSKAQEQLTRPFEIAARAGVIDKPNWQRRKGSTVALLRITPGRHVTGQLTRQPALLTEETISDIEVREIKAQSPDHLLVTSFYKQWANKTSYRPTKRELEQSHEVIGQYGEKKATRYLGLATERMEQDFPKAKRFGAAIVYIHEAAETEATAKRANHRRARQAKRQQEQERQQQAKEAEANQHTAELNHQWQQTSEAERQSIRDVVLTDNPILKQQHRKNPTAEQGIVHEMFLHELDRRLTAVNN